MNNFKTEDFYKILFDEDDFTCFSNTANGTRLYHHTAPKREYSEYFSINAIDPRTDNEPSEEYHSSDKPRRADCNVVKYRNFLVEMDGCSLSEQKRFVKEVKFPYATAVFSGGKSIHFILSLEEPLQTRDEYDRYWKTIEAVFKKIGSTIDTKCKNPSRLSRCANSYREEKDSVQHLLKIQRRINIKEFNEWCSGFATTPDDFIRPKFENIMTESTATNEEKYNFCKILMKNEKCEQGNINSFQFKIAFLCKRTGLSKDVAEYFITRDFSPIDHRDPIRSAYKKKVDEPLIVESKDKFKERMRIEKLKRLL